MAVRDKLVAAARPYLQDGEEIQAITPAQNRGVLSTGVLGALFGALAVWTSKARIVVFTDRRILVLGADKLTGLRAKGLIREVDRDTTVGPARGLSYRNSDLGETLFFPKRFHREIAAADAAIAAGRS